MTLENFLKKYPSPYGIVGLGLSGRSVIELLRSLGVGEDQIFSLDEKVSSADDLLKNAPRTLIVSPGVPLSKPWIQNFQKMGGRITSELEIATEFLNNERVIAITGSVGKSTCTALLGYAAQELNPNNFFGGNFGTPLAEYSRKVFLQKCPRADWIILELSSYQLENYKNLRCEVSVFTFLSPNHLERYPDLDTYYQTKLSLLGKTKAFAVINNRGGDLKSFFPKNTSIPSYFVDRDSDVVGRLHLYQNSLVGEHNLDNLAVCATVIENLGWDKRALDSIKNFRGLSHRLENLGLVSGVRFINDSKSTTMDSVLNAVASVKSLVSPNSHLHLLLGGRDKNLPWHQLKDLNQPGMKFYFFGECAEKAKQLSELPGDSFPQLNPCLDSVRARISSGDLVLLSPGGTSLDEFKNFEERGDYFKQWLETSFKN